MPRVKRGPKRAQKRKKVLKQSSGFFGTKSNAYRMAKQAVEKAGKYATRDRRAKKRDFRSPLDRPHQRRRPRARSLLQPVHLRPASSPAASSTARSWPSSRCARTRGRSSDLVDLAKQALAKAVGVARRGRGGDDAAGGGRVPVRAPDARGEGGARRGRGRRGGAIAPAWDALRVDWVGAQAGPAARAARRHPSRYRRPSAAPTARPFNRLKSAASRRARRRATIALARGRGGAVARRRRESTSRCPDGGRRSGIAAPGDPGLARDRARSSAGLGYSVADGPGSRDRLSQLRGCSTSRTIIRRATRRTRFFVEDGRLLRTHTSPVQIRTMLERQPPIRVICPGRVFRNDNDLRHSPMFHQVGGAVRRTAASPSATSRARCRRSSSGCSRRTPGCACGRAYFPFTEPSCEVDITCPFCRGAAARPARSTGWMEILGAGMVDPRVLENCGIDPERLLRLRLRPRSRPGGDEPAGASPTSALLFENDERLLRQVRG